jgi:DUF4097 and DUF4098 domain-containing protein YvlB
MFAGLKPVMIAFALVRFVSPATPGIVKDYRNAIQQDRRVERGSRVVVRNDFGDVIIAGTDRDTVEAVATNLNNSAAVRVSISEATFGNKQIFTVSPVASGRGDKQNIKLEVKVPRYVELEPIYLRVGNINVVDLDGGVSLRSDDGNISARRVGAPGGGLVEVMAGSGSVNLSNINGDVLIVAISSSINVQCVKGNVAGRVASGGIESSNVDGDVELNASSGYVSFTGAIHSERRYRLKVLSGNVDMNIPDRVGFTAVLTSYSGQLDTDFQFANDSQTPRRTNKRVVGKYGDGSGRIELDSFNGHVSLRKIAASSGADCPR